MKTTLIIVLFTILTFLESCKKLEISGIYSCNFQDSIRIKINKNLFRICVLTPQNSAHSDNLIIIEKCICEGIYFVKNNKLILHSITENKLMEFSIKDNETLISNCSLYFNKNDTLKCTVKYYSNGYPRWEEAKFNNELNVRTYFNQKGNSTNQVFFDKKRKKTKSEKITIYKAQSLWP